MWYQNIWLKKTAVFALALVVYLFALPEAIQSGLGCFAVGWMLVDIIDKVFN
jgi:hypothetical protein